MRPEILKSLRVRADTISQRWEALLRVEAINSRLGNADGQVQAIPASMETIFSVLAKSRRAPVSVAARHARIPDCPCGHNQCVAAFHAAEHALLEALQRLHLQLPLPARRASDIAETVIAVRRIGHTAVDAHCATCPHRMLDPRCRFRG